MYVSNKFLGDADTAGLGTTLRKGVVLFSLRRLENQDLSMMAHACNSSTVGVKAERS